MMEDIVRTSYIRNLKVKSRINNGLWYHLHQKRLGWVYLLFVMDLYNREIVGYYVSKDECTELVKRSISDALVRVESHDGFVIT